MIDDREKITYAKSELKSYYFLTREKENLKLMIDSITAMLENVKSPSVPKEDGGGGYNPFRRPKLFDDLNDAQNELKHVRCRLDRIEGFIGGLEKEDRISVRRVYLRRENKRVTLENEAQRRNYSRRGLIKRIDTLLEKF